MSEAPERPGPAPDPSKVRRALTFFRVMAFVVGVGLLLLVAGMVLKYVFDRPGLVALWAQPHGFLFIGYVVAVANLGFTLRWPATRMVLVMLAGCVPFVSFWTERSVTTDVRQRMAEGVPVA